MNWTGPGGADPLGQSLGCGIGISPQHKVTSPVRSRRPRRLFGKKARYSQATREASQGGGLRTQGSTLPQIVQLMRES